MVRSMAFRFTRYRHNFVIMLVKTPQKIMPKIQPCQNWRKKRQISQKELFLYHSRASKVKYKNINMFFTIRDRLF